MADPSKVIGSKHADAATASSWTGRPAFLRELRLSAGAPADEHPYDVPAVAELDMTLEPVTVLVGVR